MDTSSPITRRSLLAAGAGGAGVVALAACSSSGSTTDGSDTAAAPSTTESSTASSAPASSSAAPASSSSEDSSGGKDALISLDDIKVGQGASVKLPHNKPGIVTRLTATTAVCFSAICTHQGCTVAPKGGELDCPCHGSKYNLKTGAVLNGPATEPLAKIAVTVQDGKVVQS